MTKFEFSGFESINNKSVDGDDLGGTVKSEDFTIHWEEGTNDVSLVVLALKLRLEHLQSTNISSDKNAKLLWDLAKHIDQDFQNVPEIK